jgi:hypothetical protein
MLGLNKALLFISVVTIPGLPSIVAAQSKSEADPLKVYTRCTWPGDLKAKEADRRPKSTPKYRFVVTAHGDERVSVLDGYRVMFAYKGLLYYFANVKIEQSETSSYAQDKERVINELKYLSTTKQATGNIFSDKTMLNGFEHYGLDRDQIDVGLTVGTHLLLYDPDHLVITIYFLNQEDKGLLSSMLGNERRFKNLDEYHKLRDDFINHYSECLKGAAATRLQTSNP